MKRSGYLRRFHEFSRTTRYRIRRALITQRDEESSSDEDGGQRNGRLNRLAGKRGASSSSSLSSSSSETVQVGGVRRDASGTESSNSSHPENTNNDLQQAHMNDEAVNSDIGDSDNNTTSTEQSAESSDNEGNAGSSAEEDEVRSLIQEEEQLSLDNSSQAESEDDGANLPRAGEHNWGNEDDEELYEGAPLSVGESMLAILSFIIRYRLSGVCVQDLLKLIALHCKVQGNRCKTTLVQFRKFFENIQFPINRHYYCSACFNRLQNKHYVCRICGRQRGVSFFIQIPILAQLQALFKRPGFREKLQHPLTRNKRNINNYEDIYDGSVYKELKADGNLLSDPSNISLTWYTDGVSIFKSSKYELWPFYLTINELPYNQRATISNAVLAGLWFGPKKPVPNMFLCPVRDDLLRLRRGVNFETNNPNERVHVKGIVICGTCDIPAKAKFLNFKTHSSKNGCAKCKIQTINIQRGLNVYPFKENLELRTEEETIEHAREALTLPLANGARQAVFGVKGPSILNNFVYKYISTTAIDVMHCVFLGIMKMLLTLWFTPKYKDENFSLSNSMRVVNARLCAFSPPAFVKRLPRSLKDVKYWKAYELKMFLFYYSIPILRDIMKEVYFDHYLLLVHGIYLLCQSSISDEMVDEASDLLTEFVSQFENLYGMNHMSCNLHSLQHFPSTVKTHGPLWVTSCFPFEDLNGKLKNIVNGTRYAELQVCSSVSMLLKLDQLKQNIRDGPIADFCCTLTETRNKKRMIRISQSMAMMGKPRKIINLSQELEEALESSNVRGRNIYEFFRLMKYKIVFSSRSYDRSIKTNSSCVKYLNGNTESLGFVYTYLRVSNCECEDLCDTCDAKYYAIVKECITSQDFSSWPGAPLRFIQTLIAEGEMFAVEIESLCCVCFQVDVRDRNETYIIEPVNLVEPE